MTAGGHRGRPRSDLQGVACRGLPPSVGTEDPQVLLSPVAARTVPVACGMASGSSRL